MSKLVRRLKKRYVALRAEPEAPAEKVFNTIRETYLELFGVLGLIEASLKHYKARGKVVIRCSLGSLPKLLLASAAVTKIDNVPSALRVLLMSGTLRRVREDSYL